VEHFGGFLELRGSLRVAIERRCTSMTTLTYTIPEVADHLRLGRTTVYRLIGTGELPSIKVGASRRVTRDALQGYVDGLGPVG